ncbi:unnamed protein product [Callosobruchus maculatus]|uniref:Reverse transcriptase domain-containing protein n=1 Tax=Callosobruchus maculatus TaxID=64391 RepID=A0A653D7E9_CALMS|nr:unnamed protein product [Callosobruchus maculatus]
MYPYHFELNPIELVWAQVKNEVAQEAIGAVTADNWQKCVSHVKAEEEKFWKSGPHIDSVIEPVIVNLGSDTTSDNDDSIDSSAASDDEFPPLICPQLTEIQNIRIPLVLINYSRSTKVGFRKHRSTGDLLAYVTHLWNRAIENHGESRVVALDISKAFDRVWHEGLLVKLAAYGLSVRQWLNSFLNDRSLFVVVKRCSSDVFSVNTGVPHGSVLSPTLLLLYINELLEITSNPIYSFADDSTLVSCMEPGKPLSSQETVRRRQQHASQINADIKTIVEWGLANKVQFNVQKIQATTLTKKSHDGLPTAEMEGHPIVESSSVKLLGININNNMSWHDHVVSVAKTASQKLGVLFRCRKLFTPEQLLLIYKAQIRPSLEYCSHVWGCAPKHSLKLLDTIQKRAIRLVDTPNLTKDLHSLEHGRRVADLALFYRFYHGRFSSEAVRTRNTREALRTHPYQVEVLTPRTSLPQHSFFWRTSTLWNQLPGNLFPDGYNLQRFKSNVHRHLSSRSASTGP